MPTALSDAGDDAPSPAAQEDAVSLRDFHRLLHQLPAKQREALLMIGANGFTYEDMGPTVTLHGTACDQLKANPKNTVQVQYGCAIPPPIS